PYKGYSFHIILKCINLYQPKGKGKGAKAASAAAVKAMKMAGIDVQVYDPVSRLEEAREKTTDYKEPLSPYFLAEEDFEFTASQKKQFRKQNKNVWDAIT